MTQQEMIAWLHDMAEGPMAHNPEHADTCNTLTEIRVELERLADRCGELMRAQDAQRDTIAYLESRLHREKIRLQWNKINAVIDASKASD